MRERNQEKEEERKREKKYREGGTREWRRKMRERRVDNKMRGETSKKI